jgi:hypothetical protein
LIAGTSPSAPRTGIAFLLAITYSTCAFAVDCGALMAACLKTQEQEEQNCLHTYIGQDAASQQALRDCLAGAKAKRESCLKANGCP